MTLKTIDESVLRGMERSRVINALLTAGIEYSSSIPPIFAGGMLEETYQNSDALYVDVAPELRAGCWDEPLIIITFGADGRVRRVIKEFVNFCT